VEYFQENFFVDKPEELGKFLESLTKPLPKTIRVNTTRISVEDFIARAKRNNWTLTPTNNPTVFRIDRTEIKIPLGHTLEHLLGYFYIQELSASMSVHYLSLPSPPTPLLLEEMGVKIPLTLPQEYCPSGSPSF
jgi:16S rRNA (cytosine1407-C5)-methyltransferase